MRNIIQKVPIPICGVMLGFAALGNLLQVYGKFLHHTCGSIAFFLLILFLLKLILFPAQVWEDMKNPAMASVSCTLPMGSMLLTTYIEPLIGSVAFYIWFLAVVLHIVLIIYFTVKFMLKPNIQKIYASYFIIYVGIAVAAVTAPVYGQEAIGKAALWFGIAAFAILLVPVSLRYLKYPEIPEPVKPLICIYAAPVSLCIAGYLKVIQSGSAVLLLVMVIIATFFYFFALMKAIGFLTTNFYPSYAALTFPFVISAIAVCQTVNHLTTVGYPLAILKTLGYFETVVAVILVTYVFVRYIKFLFSR